MDDIFLISKQPLTMSQIAEEATSLGYEVFLNAKGDAASIRSRPPRAALTSWQHQRLLLDDPSNVSLKRLGGVDLFCVSHHRIQLAHFRDLFDFFVFRRECLVGSDDDDFSPIYSIENIHDLFS